MQLISKIRSRARAQLKSQKPRVMAMRLPGGRSLYYNAVSKAFNNEEHAVARGISRYMERTGDGAARYLLRRNVHMLEKGLTMRPRRDTFATGYILETVMAFAQFSSESTVFSDELRWMQHVLEDYFAAVAESRDETVGRARGLFLDIDGVGVTDGLGERLSPHAPGIRPGVIDVDSLLALATQRRSVRWFTEQPVAREVIEKALAIGLEAPTACNRQPFRVIVIDDPVKRVEVGSIPMGTKGYAHQLPGLMVIVGDMSAFFSERDRHLIYIDGSLAAMGIVLGLEAQNVASCCINWPDLADRERRIHASLGLEEHERVVMLVGYGYADPNGLAPYSARKPKELLYSFWDDGASRPNEVSG